MPDQPVESGTPKRAARLGVDDWLDAAVDILIEQGIEGLKIATLSSRLGVTKGSFYWHFADIGALRTALAEHCTQAQAIAVARIERLEDLPPIQRIEGLVQLISNPRRASMEAAFRRWAATDSSIADSVTHLDGRILHTADAALRELGFSAAEAHARAATLLYAGIGFVHAHGRLDEATPDDMRIFLDLLTRR